MIRRLCTLAAAVALLGLGACSEDNKVGTGVKVEKGEGGTGRLGVTTTTEAAAAPTETTAAPVATTAAPAATTTTAPKPTTTTAAPATTAAPQQAQAFVIEIFSDNSGKKQFEPPQAGVRRGTVVRWINRDSVPRSVESQEAGFQSPLLNPGESFEFKATEQGTFNYQDGTRPYAVGVLQVG